MKFINKILFSLIAIMNCYQAPAMFRAVAIQKAASSTLSMQNAQLPARNNTQLKLQNSRSELSNKMIQHQVKKEIRQVFKLFTWGKKPKYSCEFSFEADSEYDAFVQLNEAKSRLAKFVFTNESCRMPEYIRKFIYAHEIGHIQQHMTGYKPYYESINIYRDTFGLFTPDESEIRDKWSQVNHLMEFDADKRAVLALKNCQGGIDFLKSFVMKYPHLKSSSITHPSPLERIERFEQLRKEFKLQ